MRLVDNQVDLWLSQPNQRRGTSQDFCRQLLADYLGCAPHKVRQRPNQQGKPMLVDATGWRFNLSHSRNLDALLISHSYDVGIDIEYLTSLRSFNKIARRCFHPTHARQIADDPSDRAHHFYIHWVLMEAHLKNNSSTLFNRSVPKFHQNRDWIGVTGEPAPSVNSRNWLKVWLVDDLYMMAVCLSGGRRAPDITIRRWPSGEVLSLPAMTLPSKPGS